MSWVGCFVIEDEKKRNKMKRHSKGGLPFREREAVPKSKKPFSFSKKQSKG